MRYPICGTEPLDSELAARCLQFARLILQKQQIQVVSARKDVAL